MTLVSTPPRTACPNIRPNPTAPAVVALILSVLAVSATPAFAQGSTGTAMMPIAAPVSTVDSVVSKVNGPILDVLGGALQLDVTNAKITGGDDRFASPVPWAGILTGSRIVAQVTVPDAIPAVFPPRLAATNVVVFLANSGSLSGIVQGVGAAQGTFTLLYTSVKTNAATEWSGTKADGSHVKGLSDLAAGMRAVAAVSVDASGVTAKSVFAYAPPTTRIEAFRGKVEAEGATLWTISGKSVQVDANTKIVGDPKVGDTVDVLAKVQVLPPGSAAPMPLPVAIAIVKVVSTPPPPTDRTVEFDGVVESLPPAVAGMSAPLGHWTISGKDVLVTPLTRVDAGIAKGTSVHVEGVTLPMAVFAPAAAPQILATEITKK
ncbi:MAG TPA: DUF5666 domain-containing protein [Thermoanaerobaculia bacterium]|jgi:hypothetical protein